MAQCEEPRALMLRLFLVFTSSTFGKKMLRNSLSARGPLNVNLAQVSTLVGATNTRLVSADIYCTIFH